MTPNKSQQAQEYGNKMFLDNIDRLMDMPIDEIRDLFTQAYSDGYTACEQPLWRTPKEELPKDREKILIREYYRSAKTGRYVIHVREFIYFEQYGFTIEENINRNLGYCITHWMPIPSLPDTNTEKK